ncbi:MAG: hypothetical protein JWM44_1681 [Bacilli bacterium]|jgi:hypothetical protein|nr:hypothetical protein [Bacilli bacterium]
MLVRDIEKALTLAVNKSWKQDSDTISQNALIHLLRRLDKTNGEYRILQLGGGQTIFVWDSLLSLDLLPLKVTVLEHHPSRASQLIRSVESMTGITVYWNSLKQLTDDEREELFKIPEEAAVKWGKIGKSVIPDQYEHYQIRNAFYGEIHHVPLPKESIDVLIVDGPHGNGRSLAFPLLYSLLKKDALVLIDDFDHYPFAADLERIFSFEEMHRNTWGDQHWLLLRLKGIKLLHDKSKEVRKDVF